MNQTRHPVFDSGHCFMTEPLSKHEVELLGPILIEVIRDLEEDMEKEADPGERLLMKLQIAKLYSIMRKIDYPIEERTKR